MMQTEIDAGSSFVIAEARESGTVGITGQTAMHTSLLSIKLLPKLIKTKYFGKLR